VTAVDISKNRCNLSFGWSPTEWALCVCQSFSV